MRGTEIEFVQKDNDVRRLQRAALMVFWDRPFGFIMPREGALSFDQRTFPSLQRRGYIEYVPAKKGFRLTRRGSALRTYWDEANPFRARPAHQFGAALRAIEGLGGTFDARDRVRLIRKAS